MISSLTSNLLYLRPVSFFDELASNATEKNVSVVIYLGNDDSVVPHFSSESKSESWVLSKWHINKHLLSHNPGKAVL